MFKNKHIINIVENITSFVYNYVMNDIPLYSELRHKELNIGTIFVTSSIINGLTYFLAGSLVEPNKPYAHHDANIRVFLEINVKDLDKWEIIKNS